MHILGFLLILFLAIFVMALAFIGNILRSIFGIGRRKRTSNQTYGQTRHTSQNQANGNKQEKTEADNNNKKHGKVFSDDEGEYVDFEEIKD